VLKHLVAADDVPATFTAQCDGGAAAAALATDAVDIRRHGVANSATTDRLAVILILGLLSENSPVGFA
jgi:hypothetical protein